MPPKQRISKETILETAFTLLRREGEAAINARSIARAAGCSTQPIFSAYSSMDELREALCRKALAVYNQYMERGLQNGPAFKGAGAAYIAFAREEPVLFRLLYMTPLRGMNSVTGRMDENWARILQVVQEATGLSKPLAERLYLDCWIFVHGIAVMEATGTMHFTEEQISTMLSDQFLGICDRLHQQAALKEKGAADHADPEC